MLRQEELYRMHTILTYSAVGSNCCRCEDAHRPLLRGPQPSSSRTLLPCGSRSALPCSLSKAPAQTRPEQLRERRDGLHVPLHLCIRHALGEFDDSRVYGALVNREPRTPERVGVQLQE